MSGVTLKNVKKSFGAVEVIKGVDIEIGEGEFCVFVGPSGCGKSTLAADDRRARGDHRRATVEIGGRRVNDVDPSQRGAAMVFQTYALYPHMTVERNMGFGLRMNGMPKAEVTGAGRRGGADPAAGATTSTASPRRCRAASGSGWPSAAPSSAIPRCSCSTSRCRTSMPSCASPPGWSSPSCTAQLGGATMVYVTHDQVEAMTLADRIVVLRDGRVEQIGAPMELYETPGEPVRRRLHRLARR